MRKIDWKCGKCGKGYTFEEMRLLDRVKAVEKDTNPKKQHGFVSVCGCGYQFGLNKWMLKTKISLNLDSIGEIKGTVSTVFLELDHFGFWYETMIFLETYTCEFQHRYKTKENAKKGHRKILQMIENKEYTVDDKEEEIILSDVEHAVREKGDKDV